MGEYPEISVVYPKIASKVAPPNRAGARFGSMLGAWKTHGEVIVAETGIRIALP
jgi:hypothetical protein